MYKYLLFDLDGTLTDSSEGITRCVQYALDEYGFPEEPMENLLRFIGPPLRESFAMFYGLSEADAEAAVAKYRERFSPIGIYENRLYDGVWEGLKKLHEAGFIICTASSKPEPFVKRILAYFQLESFFQVVRGASFDGKIDTKAEVIRAVLQELPEDYDLKDVVMIGDRYHDVEGAQAFGIDCIGVSFGFGGRRELEEAGAMLVVDSMEELVQVIMQA